MNENEIVELPEYIWNPKLEGSGVISCIPQTGRCPNNCEDCFFQTGRSYLEPLEKNLPQIPNPELVAGRIVRMNDGNDSANMRELVEYTSKQFPDVFFNTCVPTNIAGYPGPVVLTVNPGKLTDKEFHRVPKPFSVNLMFVRVRTNSWNLDVLDEAVEYYTNNSHAVPVVVTFMAYYSKSIPEQHKVAYEWKSRTTNSYWVMTNKAHDRAIARYEGNPYVYQCGWKGTYKCRLCGICLREYYATKERMRR